MKLRRFLLFVFFTILMCACSIVKIDIAFTPVAATLQIMVCLMSGAILGGNLGALAMLAYLCLGAFVLPVFPGEGFGAEYILGPAGGYIIGFIPCAFFCGRLVHYLYNPYSTGIMQAASIFASQALSAILLYIIATLHYSLIMETGFMRALAFAALPFIWPDFLKILVSTLIIWKVFQVTGAER